MISEAALDATLEGGKRERAMLTEQIATCERAGTEVRRETADADTALATVSTLRAKLDVASPAARREIVSALVSGRGENVVTVGREQIEIAAVVGRPSDVSLVSAAS